MKKKKFSQLELFEIGSRDFLEKVEHGKKINSYLGVFFKTIDSCFYLFKLIFPFILALMVLFSSYVIVKADYDVFNTSKSVTIIAMFILIPMMLFMLSFLVGILHGFIMVSKKIITRINASRST